VHVPDDLRLKIPPEGRSEAVDRCTAEETRPHPRAPLVDTLDDPNLSEGVDEALADFGRD